ncbi:beta-glucosidase-related glycosidase [Mollisia scopiformis]|uniref:beta-glucosidase n=1 Tax=Mollisia scopiformis TaxID=149040 RepID=A0A132B2I7_MOLSC|nr:beta-glucosidase-related glycosidase [Mollisia scopiformis]KUJ06463.1 beta-glucosidase-related glycosidase [Mollisia scopiformis]
MGKLTRATGVREENGRDKYFCEVQLYGLSPPVYPTPEGQGTSSPEWTAAYTKARAFIAQLTFDEKLNLTRGFTGSCVGNTGSVPRLGFKGLYFEDAPAGIRGPDFVSAFPAGSHLAQTWDREYMYAYGKALGEEYYGKGVNVALGPVGGPLGRVARAGRNWEGPGPDPYVTGVQMEEVVKGMQGAGVIACSKHFLFNEQEYRRLPNELGESMSSNVDDLTLHELYAWPFMNALKAGTGAVMCSYQRANNSYSCQNSKLLNGILKTEFGFEGFVVSDWQAQQSGVSTANAGLDIVMPDGGFWGKNLSEAVTNGSVSIERLNDMVTRTMASFYFLNQNDSYPEAQIFSPTVQHPILDVRSDHDKVIREIGAAGHVLVKNVNKTLPLKKPRYVSIFGYDAEVKAVPWTNPLRYGGGYEVNFGWNTFNGTLIVGGGSGSNTPPYVISPFKAIQDRVIADREANSEVCLVFINAYASESFDRTSLSDKFSDNLVLNVAGQCSNTVVVLHSAGPRVVDAWIEHENVTAVIFGGLPGQESGHALVDVLYGDVNPSGKLVHTIAKKDEDYGDLLNSTIDFSAFPQQNFSEGVYIDYRAFDRNAIEPRFEFGYGLSYTEFAYSNLTIVKTGANTAEYPSADVSIVQGGHPELWDILFNVTAAITNIGDVAGAEIAQLYLGVPGAPIRQLRGFDKVMVQRNSTAHVIFPLTRRDLSVWDVVAQKWRLQTAEYNITVGASSRDLRLNATLQL